MRYEGECDICGIYCPCVSKRDNDMELCDTCALLSETEPEGSNVFNEVTK